ncbi:MAG: alpha/beta hydrolase [Bacteroidota bacterium]
MKIKKKIILLMLLLVIVLPIIVLAISISFENSKFEEWIVEMKSEELIPVKITTPVEHKIYETNGYGIHYYVSGQEHEEAIIFLHPAFSDHQAFDLQVDYFSKSYKVISLDMIGHGKSKAGKSKDKIDASADHIKEIMELEGIESAHLVAVSMGTLIAQYFALQHPDMIKSVTALGGYNINESNKEVEKAQRNSNLSLMARAILSMKSFRQKTAKMTCESERGQALFYLSSGDYERKSFMVMQGFQNIIKDRPQAEISYPLLIMVGEKDIDLALKMSNDWHKAVAISQFEVIKSAGHCANMDQPKEFNFIVADFISQETINN